jgi:hypothetical protein
MVGNQSLQMVCSLVPPSLQMAQIEAQGIWYFVKEHDGALCTVPKGQN